MKLDDLMGEYSTKAAEDSQQRATRPVQTRNEPERTAKHPPKKPKKAKPAEVEAKPVPITDPKELEETVAWLARETGIRVTRNRGAR